MMLTIEEQNDLYDVIVASLGEDSSIRGVKAGFNELTVDQVEQVIIEQAKCNQLMKELVADLLGGSSLFAKGWLRKNLKKFSKTLKDEKVKFNGYGCLVKTKSNWKSAIMATTI